MHRPVADALASVLNSSSVVGSGWTLTFYSLADALQEVYTDTDWVTPASTAGVLTANSSGRFSKAFFKDDLNYKAVLKDADGATVTTINPIYKAAGYLDASDLTGYLQKSGGDMTGALNFAEGAAIASAATVNFNSATGNFLHVTGTTGISAITLQQGAMRWVVFDGILTLTHSANLLLGGYDITTAAGMVLIFAGEGSSVTRLVGGVTATGRAIMEGVDLIVPLGDETTALTTGTAKFSFRAPFAFSMNAIPRGSLTTAQASGSIVTFDVNVASSSILSTKLTIDNNEVTSTTAATAAAMTSAVVDVADDALITFDIDQCDGSTTAAGAKIHLRGFRRAP